MCTAGVAAADEVPDGVADGPPAAAVRTTRPVRTFSLAAGGDVLPESPVLAAAAHAAAAQGGRYDFGPQLAPLQPILRNVDLAICHMEIPIGTPGERPGLYGRSPNGGGQLLAPNELAGALAAAGFDRCSTASNHSWDLGPAGIDSTLAALELDGCHPRRHGAGAG
jgi:hypothetical protein